MAHRAHLQESRVVSCVLGQVGVAVVQRHLHIELVRQLCPEYTVSAFAWHRVLHSVSQLNDWHAVSAAGMQDTRQANLVQEVCSLLRTPKA